MKNLKIKFVILSAIGLGAVAVSCSESFLEVTPTGQLSEAQLTSTDGLDAALIATYSQVNGRGAVQASISSNWVWGSIRGGDANKGTDPGDSDRLNPIQRFETDPVNLHVYQNWQQLYEGVARANSVLSLIASKSEDVTEADVVRITSQAKFLRAHFYFQLIRNFKNIPYVDETVDYGNGLEEIKNDTDVWPKIEADFKYAVENLPATQPQVGRVNSWAAKAYLAKVYLYQGKYLEARALFQDVIENGVTSDGKKYDLVPDYANVFRGDYDNNEETVWAYQSAAGTGSVSNANPELVLNFPYNAAAPGVCCGFFQPSFTFVNSFRTNAEGLPLLEGSYDNPAYNTASNQVKNDYGVKSDEAFTPDMGTLDPRLDHTVGRRGIPYLDWQDHPGSSWIRKQDYAGPYSSKKYVYTKSEQGSFQDNSSWTPGYTGMNMYIIRFADVLLMAAEAEIEAPDGDLSRAMKYVNRIRTRAMNSKLMRSNGTMAANYLINTYKGSWDKETAREVVRFERKLELGMEGHRFYDLVRWGIADPVLNAYLDFDGAILSTALGGATFTPTHELLPIPQNQIDLLGSDILTQNPGF